jgi:hypothetical protein
MAIGNAATQTQASVNNYAAQTAIQLRTVMNQISALAVEVNNLGTAGLIALGFASADATAMVSAVDNMLSLAQIYQGSLQQGGTGGTGASLFNFQTALVALTGLY